MRTALEVVAWIVLIAIDGVSLVLAVMVIRWAFRHVFGPMFAELGHILADLFRPQGGAE